MHNWASLHEFFETLNDNIEYIILRNYETFAQESLLDEHSDIDLLCFDGIKMRDLLKGSPRYKRDDKIHYKICVNGKSIPVDIRTVGDGYYDAVWERKLLEQRIFIDMGFYVLNKEDYFYTLLYHALIQKYEIAEDYLVRLDAFANDIGIEFKYPLENILDSFMADNGYFYTYPRYIKCKLNFRNIDAKLIERNVGKKLVHDTYRLLGNIKRRLKKWVKK